MELGIEDEEDKLYKQADDVAKNVLDNLDSNNNTTALKTYNSKNSNYTFQMNVYCQKLDTQELDEIFNYINRRFGAEY